MRVLLVGSYGPSLVNFRGPLITALVAAGHEVHVAAPDLDGGLREGLKALDAEVHDTPLDRQGTGFRADLNYLQQLTTLFRAVNPGLVITYTIKPNIWGALAGARARVRTVALVTGLGIVFTDTGKADSLKSRMMKRMVHWLYRRASNRNWRLVLQNPDDLADFKAAGCLSDRSKVRMMNGSGIDMTRYPPMPLPGTPDFLMISRILGAKGVREYARAALTVKQIHPEARFRLVGFHDKGPDAIPESEVAEWVAGGLEYLGPSEDVVPHLAACHVYVLPSYREGTPRSVLEAMATVAGIFGLILFPLRPLRIALMSLRGKFRYLPAVLMGLVAFGLFHFVGRQPVFWVALVMIERLLREAPEVPSHSILKTKINNAARV